MAKPILEVDGNEFGNLDEFYDVVTTKLGISGWGRNLDALNDVLRGGFGAPQGGFVLRWSHSQRSREVLGYGATISYLEGKRVRCHPANIQHVEAELEAARREEGQTLFDLLVEIIRLHGPGGHEQEDGVELELR